MLGTSLALLLLALGALRFPAIPLFALLPAAIGAGIASVLPRDRGAWIAGLLAGAFLAELPGGLPLGLVTALAPAAAVFLPRVLPVHPLLRAALAVLAAGYLAAGAGSGSWSLPLARPADLCAALAVGATLSVLAYASTQRERLGPRGRAGFRIR